MDWQFLGGQLSELEGGGELEEHDDDGFDDPVSKPHSLTMLDPTSPPIKAFLKLQEIEQLNKSRRRHPETVSLRSSKPHQVLSPMAGAKSRAFTANLEESKLGHKEQVLQEFLLLPGVCLQSSSQLSLLPLPRFELNLTHEKTSSTTQQEQNNDNNNHPSSSTRFQFLDPFEPTTDPNSNPQLNALPPVIKSSALPEGMKIGSSMESSFGNFSQQPFTSAQKLLLFDLNRKRKRKLAATQSLVSLVGDYWGAASTNELKNPPPPPPHTSSSLERLNPWSLSLPFTKWINLHIEMRKKSCKTTYTKLQYHSAHGHTWGAHGVHMGGDIFVKDYNWKVRVLLMDLPVDLCKWIKWITRSKKLELEKVWVEKMAFWS